MSIDRIAFKRKTGKKPSVLIFSFSQLVGLYILTSFDVEIAVPEGEEEMACNIAGMPESSVNREECTPSRMDRF